MEETKEVLEILTSMVLQYLQQTNTEEVKESESNE